MTSNAREPLHSKHGTSTACLLLVLALVVEVGPEAAAQDAPATVTAPPGSPPTSEPIQAPTVTPSPTPPAAQSAQSAQPDDSNAQVELLREGTVALKAGDRQRAISEYFDKVIAYYEARYKDNPALVFSAQSPTQALLYAASGAGAKRDTLVLDAVWADSHLARAYALSELGRVEEARKDLEAAIALSPMSSQYLSELAYTYQLDRNWEASLDQYRKAAGAADMSAEASRKADLGRAWRGEAYGLVELGKLDEAQALYQKCLQLDRNDGKARNELEYIRELRKKTHP